ncbi:MAG: two pore domain potassium channel family protein [Actinomycetota bacterium]|nr:MAG: two pore domain potassium channel family protein [Actinomycetota bacterium]
MTRQQPQRRARWFRAYERHSQYPMFLLAVLFCVGLVLLLDSGGDSASARSLLLLCWLGFFLDYGLSLLLTDDRLGYIRRNPLALIALIIPALRILLLGRAFKILTRDAPARFAQRVQFVAVYLTTLVVFFAAVLVLVAERNAPGANITTFGNALWWALVTIPTVGYGDYYPITFFGRAVAVALFFNGVALLSIVTATLSQRFLDRRSRRAGMVESGGPQAGGVTDGERDELPVADAIARLEAVAARLEALAARPGRLGTGEGE